MIATQYINLNMVPSGYPPVVYMSQYDVGRPIGFVVSASGSTPDFDSYTVTLEGTRSDGTPVTAPVTTDGNICALETTATMTNKTDRYPANIVVTDGNGNRIASIPVTMMVVKAAMDENAEGVEEDRSLYQQYTGTVQSLIADTRTQLNAETAARQAAVSAEASARQAADNTLQSNINAEASTRATQDASLQSQINQLIAPSGEAPSAAEVENARVGADGTVYSTLGDAIRGQVTDVKTAIDEIRGSTRNIFDPTYLVSKAGWTRAGGVYSGTALKLHQNFNTAPYYPISGFKSSTRYTLSLKGYTDGNEGTTGSGVMICWIYSDGTNNGVQLPNNTTTETSFTWTSQANKTVVALRITYGGNGGNVWHLSNIQLEEGTEKTDYIQHFTAVDSLARANIDGLKTDIDDINDKIAWPEIVNIPWENGNIYMTASAIYYNPSNADKRIRTPQGYVLKLNVGDTITIPSDGSVKIYVGWKTQNNEYAYVGWLQSTFTAEVDSEYYIVARFDPERTLESVSELSQHITVTKYENIREDLTSLDNRVTDLENGTVPGMVVPEYFEANLASAISDAQAAMVSASINGETFVFLSDIHWENNEKHSPALVKAVTDALPIENTIYGGDTFNGGTQATVIGYMNDARQKFTEASPHFLAVYGNHDGNQLDGGTAFTHDEFYTFMQKQADYYVKYEAPCYYYMDNEATKTRFIFLDSRTGTPSTASAQLAWLQSITGNALTGWHFLVFVHVIFYPDTGGSYSDPTTWIMSPFMTNICAALDSVNATGTNKVEAIFGGHCHIDYNSQTSGGIPIVMIDCDTKQTASGNSQTVGTTGEQCLDIVTVDYSAEKISCARIGRGSSRTITY